MRKTVASILILLIALCAIPACADALSYTPDVSLGCSAAYLYNTDTDTVVYEKAANEAFEPGSVTKLTTALVALEKCPNIKNTTVEVTASLWNYFVYGSNPSLSGIQPSEKLTMEQLLHCMLLPSGCDAAVAIAAYFGYSDFIEAMNAKAAELGCVNTHYINPHGLSVEGHYSCAGDIGRIAREVAANPVLSEICAKSRYYLPKTNKNEARTLATTNSMLDSTTRYYTSYISGLKTGYTNTGGRAFATRATVGEKTFILVLMHGPLFSDGKWEEGSSTFNDTAAMMEWCADNLILSHGTDRDMPLVELELRGSAQRDTLLAYPNGSADYLAQNGDEISITYEYSLPEFVKAPVTRGQTLGTAKVFANGEHIADVELISRDDIKLNVLVAAVDAVSAIVFSIYGKIAIAAIALILVGLVIYTRVVLPRRRANRTKK